MAVRGDPRQDSLREASRIKNFKHKTVNSWGLIPPTPPLLDQPHLFLIKCFDTYIIYVTLNLILVDASYLHIMQ